MKKNIYSKIDKKFITDMPQVLFPGKIVVISTVPEADRAVEILMRSDLLGLDTETKPVFKRGHTNKVGLLQVSTRELCFLFRLNIIGIPDSVATLLENKDIPLIGLSLHDDVLALRKRREFTPGNFVDLQKIVGKIGIEDLSLQKLYANLFHQKISKRQRLTNWEAKELTEKQQGYAATDAWACIMLYEEINRLNDTQDYNLIPSPEPKEEEVKEEVLAEEIKQ